MDVVSLSMVTSSLHLHVVSIWRGGGGGERVRVHLLSAHSLSLQLIPFGEKCHVKGVRVDTTLAMQLPEIDGAKDSVRETLSSPQFYQAMQTFEQALATGEGGSLLSSFGLPQVAGEFGPVEEFLRAIMSSTRAQEEEE